MVELKERVYYSEGYDIDIQRYLTYAQIQQIVNAVVAASKDDDSWSARQTNIDMLVLMQATNIGKDKLEEIGHEMLVKSGLVEYVMSNVLNIGEIYMALDYTESLTRAGSKMMTELAKVIKTDTFKAAIKKYGK